MISELNRELLDFIEKSPSAFHAVENFRKMLLEAGYQELLESEKWELQPGGRYFVTRNDSSLISFRIPEESFEGFMLIASHCDSPTFKIKENPEMKADNHYTKLNVEPYGGSLYSPWFDRPLSFAGRVVVRTDDGVETRLVDVDRDLLMIPNLAVHMNREANSGHTYNEQKELLPVLGDISAFGSFSKLVAEQAGAEEKEVLCTDLFLYSRGKGTVWGANEEFLSAPRLDDLQCAFASMKGFLAAKEGKGLPVCCIFDNEEVGSGTKQGAASTLLSDVLHRINGALGRTEEDYLQAVAQSFMISADNAHAVHPNYSDVADPVNRPYMNEGIVIKYNAAQRYTTDGISGAVFKLFCERAGVPCQTYTNRSDIRGGSTLGNISNTQVALNTVDIGLPQLAMHSPYETCGTKDTEYFVKAAEEFFSSHLKMKKNGSYAITKIS
jgi:aspartyl aminopeptidase